MSSLPKEPVLLLYMDILGFKELAKQKTPEEIAALFRQHVLPIVEIGIRTDGLDGLSFSDTVILWKRLPDKPDSMDDDAFEKAFFDLLLTANLLTVTLLKEHIPVRGVIHSGPFWRLDTKSNQAQVFFGQALIDAYLAETSMNWIGIQTMPSVTARLSPEYIKRKSSQLVFMPKENQGQVYLLLNPLMALRNESGWRELYHDSPELVDHAEDELRALRFLLRQFTRYRLEGRFDERTHQKYSATLDFLRTIFGPRNFDLLATRALKK